MSDPLSVLSGRHLAASLT